MTKESALIVSLAAIVGGIVLGVGFSTGFFHPEPLATMGGIKPDEAAIITTANRKDTPSLMRHAQDHLALREFKEAIFFLRAATQLDPRDANALRLLAGAAFQVKDMTLAANTCHALTQLDPTDMGAQIGLAKALSALHLFPDSAAACRAVLTNADVSSPVRAEARRILQHIPVTEQRKAPEVLFPLLSAD